MKFLLTHLASAGLILAVPALAQTNFPPAPGRPAPPARPPIVKPLIAPAAEAADAAFAVKSSRIQAIDFRPDGAVQCLFLRDGTVVNVSPDLALRLTTAVRKGEKLVASGPSRKIAEQVILDARSLTVGGQTLTAQTPPIGAAVGELNSPPPPNPDDFRRETGARPERSLPPPPHPVAEGPLVVPSPPPGAIAPGVPPASQRTSVRVPPSPPAEVIANRASPPTPPAPPQKDNVTGPPPPPPPPQP